MGKNVIQNVRMVDPDSGTDDIKVNSLLSAYKVSEGQIRVVCTGNQDLTPAGGSSASYSTDLLTSTDDFISFAQQYQEFRIRAIRFDVFDVQPNSASTINYLATYHQIDGNVPGTAADVVDRPDSRTIPPGTGHARLAWVAHGQPEMEFQSVTSYQRFGGLVFYTSPSAPVVGTKYSLIAKFIVDFRGRR
jgi:hypothetical protein